MTEPHASQLSWWVQLMGGFTQTTITTFNLLSLTSSVFSVCLFCVWDVGCATANQLTNCSIRFNSHSYASLPGETTSIFNYFKSHDEARSWKRAPGWWILSTTKNRKRTPKFLRRVSYRKVSVRCTINAERQACAMQHLLLQFLGLFCHLWQNLWCRTTRRLKVSHQQRISH